RSGRGKTAPFHGKKLPADSEDAADTWRPPRRLWKDKSHAPPVPVHETARIDKKQVLRSRPRGPARCAASRPGVPSAGLTVEIGSCSSPSFHANIKREISTKVKLKIDRTSLPAILHFLFSRTPHPGSQTAGPAPCSPARRQPSEDPPG